MERLSLEIDGMSCAHCVAAVTNALKSVPGVTIEQVAVGGATVSYDRAIASPAAIIDAVNDEGYAAHTASAH